MIGKIRKYVHDRKDNKITKGTRSDSQTDVQTELLRGSMKNENN